MPDASVASSACGSGTQDSATPWFELLWASPDELGALVEPFGWRLADVRPDGAAYAAELRRS